MEDMGNYGYTLFRTIPCFHKEFPHAVSYNRFVELMPRVFCKMMLFMIAECWSVFTKVLHGKVFADRVFVSKNQSS